MMNAYLQMAIALVAVIGLIILMGFLVKKKQATGTMMKVLAYLSLGQRKGLVAVKVNNEVLLLGITAADLRLIKSYEPGDFKSEPVTEINEKLKKLKTLKETLYEHN